MGVGWSLCGWMFGFYGYGWIGQVVVDYVKVFGMKVVWWGLEQGCVCVVVDGELVVKSCEEFFVWLDVILVYVRLKLEIKGIIIVVDFVMMKFWVIFVNILCVGLVEEGVLLVGLS